MTKLTCECMSEQFHLFHCESLCTISFARVTQQCRKVLICGGELVKHATVMQ